MERSARWFVLAIALPVMAQSNAVALVIVSGALAGSAYVQNLSANGTAPVYWSVTAGALPAGLSLTPATRRDHRGACGGGCFPLFGDRGRRGRLEFPAVNPHRELPLTPHT